MSKTDVGAILTAIPGAVSPIIDAVIGAINEKRILAAKAEAIMAKQQAEVFEMAMKINSARAKSYWMTKEKYKQLLIDHGITPPEEEPVIDGD